MNRRQLFLAGLATLIPASVLKARVATKPVPKPTPAPSPWGFEYNGVPIPNPTHMEFHKQKMYDYAGNYVMDQVTLVVLGVVPLATDADEVRRKLSVPHQALNYSTRNGDLLRVAANSKPYLGAMPVSVSAAKVDGDVFANVTVTAGIGQFAEVTEKH